MKSQSGWLAFEEHAPPSSEPPIWGLLRFSEMDQPGNKDINDVFVCIHFTNKRTIVLRSVSIKTTP
jgi:hypothetical protein